ncbi:MAG: DNA cytosine methyltransferase [Salinarimonadaceae bacterium]|nr:MAG: DNA cytosine methyltransferase [Salinarimonadaceae bacterium]
MPTFLEFFAGGGLVRAGLGPGWTCLLANDIDPMKAAAYSLNWGEAEFVLGDVKAIASDQIPGRADLLWGSFPCQDLSLAGAGRGLAGERSGTFRSLERIVAQLRAQDRAPPLVCVENVVGLLTSNSGRDFAEVVASFVRLGYRVGAMVIDAARFTPQSRPRLFVVAACGSLAIDDALLDGEGARWWSTPALERARAQLPDESRQRFIRWRLPGPPAPNARLGDIVEDDPRGVAWHTPEQTQRLLALMAPLHRTRVEAAKGAGRRMVGGLYRRTRSERDGVSRQRAEVRFDGLAGCLRTPAGGSSRQTLLVVEGERVRSRLLSPREAARLMGLPDSFRLPARYNDACHVLGDGVAAPAVRHLAAHLFEPLLARAAHGAMAAE